MKLAIAFVVLIALVAGPAAIDAATVGDRVPGFSLQGLDGKTHTDIQYNSKVLVLYFMGYA